MQRAEQFGFESGILGGVQIGYNVRNGRLVFGLEADFSGVDLSTAPGGALVSYSLSDGKYEGDIGTFQSQVDWFGTARARAGVLLDESTLFYGTGGLAYGHVTNSIGYRFDTDGDISEDSFTSSDVRVGWTAGAGVETALNDRMKLKFEYLYVDLGSSQFLNSQLLNVFNVITVDAGAFSDVGFHVARVGLNITFDSFLAGQ